LALGTPDYLEEGQEHTTHVANSFSGRPPTFCAVAAASKLDKGFIGNLRAFK